MSILGKAYFKNYDNYIKFINSEEGTDWYLNLWEPGKETNTVQNLITFYNKVSLFDTRERVVRKTWPLDKTEVNSPFTDIMEYEKKYNKGFDVIYKDDDKQFVVIQYGTIDDAALIPMQFLDLRWPTDYSSLSGEQLNGIRGDSFALTTGTELSVKDIAEQKTEKEKNINDILEQINNVKNEADGKLAKMRQEIREKEAELEAKKNSILNELLKKQEELNIQVAGLNKTIFQLTSEIYAIQCFMGETIDFILLNDGRPAPDDEPMVLYQKLRYMDNELAKRMALKNVDFDEHRLFEDFLTMSPEAQDIFYPDDKCIMAVRVSESEYGYGSAFAKDGTPLNMITAYKKYHGKKVGLIVRNGERLYMGWTDDEMLTVKKDLFHITEQIDYAPEDAEIQIEAIEAAKDAQSLAAKGYGKYKPTPEQKDVISRYFLFNIIQGFINRGILKFPEDVNLMKESPYVVFSKADNWIHTTKYGSFSEILEKYECIPRAGDTVLTLMRLYDTSDASDYWNRDDRGHSSKNSWGYNRTQGARVEDRTLYKINIVEKETNDKGEETRIVFVLVDRDVWKWNSKEGLKCNFRLDDTEYINLTFLNTLLIDSVLSSEDFGGWMINGHQVNYSYGASYLWKAKEFLMERESFVSQMMIKFGYPAYFPYEWQMKMSEWMMEKDVHNMTEYQVKRFAKWLFENHEK